MSAASSFEKEVIAEPPTTITSSDDTSSVGDNVGAVEEGQEPSISVTSSDNTGPRRNSAEAARGGQQPSTPAAARDNAGPEYSSMDAAEAHTGHAPRRLSSWGALSILVSLTCSLGSLSLPKAVASVGIIPFALIVIFAACLVYVTGVKMWRCVIEHPEARSYPQVMRIAFGSRGGLGFWIGVCSMYFAMMTIMAAHAVGLGHVIRNFGVDFLSNKARAAIGAAAMLVFSIPFRSFGEGVYVAIPSCVSFVAVIFIRILGVLVSPVPDGGRLQVAFEQTTASTFGVTMSTALFILMVHTAFPPLIVEMRNPRDFPWVLRWLLYLTVGVMLSIGIWFYAVFGNAVKPTVLDSVRGKPFRILACTFAVPTVGIAGIFSSKVAVQPFFEALAKPLFDALATRLKHRGYVVGISSERREKTILYVIWAVLLSICWATAYIYSVIVTHLETIVSLTGAIFAPWFCVGSVFLLWMRCNGSWLGMRLKVKKGDLQALLMLLLLGLGVTLMAFGIWGNVVEWPHTSATNSTAPPMAAD